MKLKKKFFTALIIALQWVVLQAAEENVVNFKFDSDSVIARPSWIVNTAGEYGFETTTSDSGHFWVCGDQKAMRWTFKFQAAKNLRYKYLSFCYRVNGELSAGTKKYLFHLAGTDLLSSGQLINDNNWHFIQTELPEKRNNHPVMWMTTQPGDLSRADLWIKDLCVSEKKLPQPKLPESIDLTPAETQAWQNAASGFHPVELRYKENTENTKILKREKKFSTFPDAKILVSGIPFLTSGKAGYSEWLEPGKNITIPLPQTEQASALYFLTDAKLGKEIVGIVHENGVIVPKKAPIKILDNPAVFAIELEYADGKKQVSMPYSLQTRKYGINNGLAAYMIPVKYKDKLIKCRLVNNSSDSLFAIDALTLFSAPRPELKIPTAYIPPQSKKTELPKAGQPRIRQQDDLLKIDTGRIKVELNLTEGLKLENLSIAAPGKLHFKKEPLFQIIVNGKKITPEKLELVNVEISENKRANIKYLHEESKLELEIILETLNASLSIQMTSKNVGTQRFNIKMLLPVFQEISIGKTENSWYFIPMKFGGMVDNKNISYGKAYGVHHPLQMDGIFNPELGWGLMFSTSDTNALTVLQRNYIFAKKQNGINYIVQYWDTKVGPGERLETSKERIEVVAGGWRELLTTYRNWFRKNFKLRKVPDWFKKHHVTYDFIMFGMRPEDAKNFSKFISYFKEQLGDAALFHLYGWQSGKKGPDAGGMYGDFQNFDQCGGKENFHEQIAKCRAQGTNVTPYYDHLLLSRNSKAMGSTRKKFIMKNAKGKDIVYKNKADYQCLFCEPWRKHLVDTAEKLKNELNLKSLYLDQVGGGYHFCYNEEHDHPIPAGGVTIDSVFVHDMRERMPDMVFYSEHLPADCMWQYLEGTLCSRRKVTGEPSIDPHLIDYVNYIAPEFKRFHFQHPGFPLDISNMEEVIQMPFFMGDGYMFHTYTFEGKDPRFPWAKWSPDATKKMKNSIRILDSYSPAFHSPKAEPQVQTLIPGVYANYFPGKDYEVWTLYNANYDSVDGELFEAENTTGKDLWLNEWDKSPVKYENGKVSGFIPPRAVSCIVRKKKH